MKDGLIDLGWHYELVTCASGALRWAWTHWYKLGALGERRCDDIRFQLERP